MPLPPQDERRARREPRSSFFARIALALTLAGCAPIAVPPSSTSERLETAGTSARVAPALGASFDVTPAYPGYQWTRDGRAVAPEELGTIAGPEHCGWSAATFLSIGWPVGTRSVSSAEARQYIRDPRGVVRPNLRDRFGPKVTLPSDARPTGYRLGSIEIYLSPTDQDEAVYVVGPAGAERWPRSDPMTLCS